MALVGMSVLSNPGLYGSNTTITGSRMGYAHSIVTGGGLGFSSLAMSTSRNNGANIVNVIGYNSFQFYITRPNTSALTINIYIDHCDDALSGGLPQVIHTDTFAFSSSSATNIVTFGRRSANLSDRLFSYIRVGCALGAGSETFTVFDLVANSM